MDLGFSASFIMNQMRTLLRLWKHWFWRLNNNFTTSKQMIITDDNHTLNQTFLIFENYK
jgi:hypothetical protein